MEHTAGVDALLGLTASPESPASVAVSRPSDVLVARVAVAQTATALLEASGSEEANARFSIGEPSGYSSERCLATSQACVAGGLKSRVESPLRDQIWLMLIGNAAPQSSHCSRPGPLSPRFALSQLSAADVTGCFTIAGGPVHSRRSTSGHGRSVVLLGGA